MNKQMWWHSIVILLLCVGCTADGVKRTRMPNIMYPASAQFTSTPTPLALNQHGRTVSYITELAPAEIVQYYVNEKNLDGWDDIFIREPNRTLELASMKCPIIEMTVLITPTITYTDVSLRFSEDDCI